MTAPRNMPRNRHGNRPASGSTANPACGSTPNFDRLARPYRWMEYLSFGRALERCRYHFLDRVHDRRRALVLGDGDGRFTARLLAQNPAMRVHAIDGSRAMLTALAHRAHRIAAADRLTTEHADLRVWTSVCTGDGTDIGAGIGTGAIPAPDTPRHKEIPPGAADLIVTHFFLDCLTTEEVERLARQLHAHAAPNALWMVSEFAIPARGWMHPLAAALIAVLYRAFRLLTGLGPQQLPQYTSALQRAGWRRDERREHLRGLLVSELWRRAKESSGLRP